MPIWKPWLDWCESENGQGYRWGRNNVPVIFNAYITPRITFNHYETSATTTDYEVNWDTNTERWSPWLSTTITTGGGGGSFHPLTYHGERLYMADEEPRVVLEAARAEREQVYQDRLRRSEERIVAQSRAIDLLVTLLPPEQVAVFREHKHFEIVGSHGTRYRVNEGVSGNIEWLRPDGQVGGRLCAHPTMCDGWLPTADVMLSQLLALITDEMAFVRLANVHAGRRPELVAA